MPCSLVSGVVTSVPLFLFSYGARRVPYSTIGVIQFIAPSMQLACGLLVFGEPFESARATGFVLIWIGSADLHRKRLVAGTFAQARDDIAGYATLRCRLIGAK